VAPVGQEERQGWDGHHRQPPEALQHGARVTAVTRQEELHRQRVRGDLQALHQYRLTIEVILI